MPLPATLLSKPQAPLLSDSKGHRKYNNVDTRRRLHEVPIVKRRQLSISVDKREYFLAAPDWCRKSPRRRRQAQLFINFDVDLPREHTAAELQNFGADALAAPAFKGGSRFHGNGGCRRQQALTHSGTRARASSRTWPGHSRDAMLPSSGSASSAASPVPTIRRRGQGRCAGRSEAAR